MKDFPKVSVIVLSWNARPLLEKCLPSVVASDYPELEVILADNGSDDDSVAWVRSALPTVRILELGDNLGFCKGNNNAIRSTSGSYVVLLNNDVEVEPGWLTPLVERAESDASVGALQPKLLQFDLRGRFEYAGACGGHLDRLGYPFARGRVFFTLEDDVGQYNDDVDIFWATGAALFLRRSALDQVGLLDESFEFHMEEIDLCWRLWRAGYRVGVVPEACVYHIGGGSLPQGNPRKTYYNFRNSLLMLYKNMPRRLWTQVFLQRLALDGLAAARFFLRGEWGSFAAVLRAYAHAHRLKNAYEPPSHSVAPFYRRSIIWDYYARGKRTFRSLDDGRFSWPT